MNLPAPLQRLEHRLSLVTWRLVRHKPLLLARAGWRRGSHWRWCRQSCVKGQRYCRPVKGTPQKAPQRLAGAFMPS